MNDTPALPCRVADALKTQFIADALAMPAVFFKLVGTDS